MLDRDRYSRCHTSSAVPGLNAVMTSVLGTPTSSPRWASPTIDAVWPIAPGAGFNVSPTGFTLKEMAAFLPVTYNSCVLGLKEGEPKLEPPCERMYDSFVEYGKYIGRARFASSGLEITG